jgi:hypothetical protein
MVVVVAKEAATEAAAEVAAEATAATAVAAATEGAAASKAAAITKGAGATEGAAATTASGSLVHHSCPKTCLPPARLITVGLACSLVNNLCRKLAWSSSQKSLDPPTSTSTAIISMSTQSGRVQTTVLGLVDDGDAWEDGGWSWGGRRQQKGHVGNGLVLDTAGAVAEAVTTAAEE